MYIQVKDFEILKEHVETFCNKWSQRDRKIDGLEKVEVLRDARKDRDVQKVKVQLYWQSKEAHKAWTVHPDHIAGHKNAPKRPEWIVSSRQEGYYLW